MNNPCPVCGGVREITFIVQPQLDPGLCAPTMNGPSLPGVLLLAGLGLAVIARRMRRREGR